MFCTNCGKELADGMLFCTNCGAPVRAVQQAQETVPAVEEAVPAAEEAAAFAAGETAVNEQVQETAQEATPAAEEAAAFAAGEAAAVNEQVQETVQEAVPAAEGVAVFAAGEAAVVGEQVQEAAAPADQMQYQQYGEPQYDPNGQYGGPQYDPNAQYGAPMGEEQPKKGNGKILKISLAALAVLLIAGAALWFFVFRTKTYDMNPADYYSIKYTGFNGNAKCEAEFNKDKFVEDYSGKLKFTDKSIAAVYDDPVEYLADMFAWSCYPSKDSELSNGDKTELDLSDITKGMEEYINLKVEPTVIAYTVEGLEDRITIDVAKFYKVTFTGANGYGKTDECTFDKDAFVAEYGSKIKRSDGTTDGVAESVANAVYVYTFEENLSNGDIIKLDFTDYAEYACWDTNVQFASTCVEIMVEGLADAEEVNPFEYIEVQFEGQNEKGTLNINRASNSPDWMYGLDVEVDKSENLKNGDTIKVDIVEYDEAIMANRYGVKVGTLSQEYKVEGLEEYVAKASDIVYDFKTMAASTADEITESLKTGLGIENATFKSEYIGYRFYSTAKPNDKLNNMLIFYYLVTIEEGGASAKCYMAYGCTGLMNTVDGSGNPDLDVDDDLVFFPAEYTQGDTFTLGNYTMQLRGFDSLEKLNELVAGATGSYKLETDTVENR